MPIYEYKCRACEGEFEKLIRNQGDEAGIHCPHCSSSDVQRLFSTFGFRAKGTSVSSNSSACSSCSASTCSTCKL